MGGDKAARALRGRPLVSYPVAALRAVCSTVVVVAKPDVPLPVLEGVERWDEPFAEHHPAAGIAYALERAGEQVLVCGADMPFVTASALRALLLAAPAVAVTDGRLQPLLAAYAVDAAPALRACAEAGEPLTRAVEALRDVARVEVPPRVALSVDTPEELARLDGAPNVPDCRL
jgi:molybdopterin-guanine dinucleotide biosynthesis protein A